MVQRMFIQKTPLNKGLVTGRIHTAPNSFPGSAASAAIATR
jgi:hypothetical protein